MNREGKRSTTPKKIYAGAVNTSPWKEKKSEFWILAEEKETAEDSIMTGT